MVVAEDMTLASRVWLCVGEKYLGEEERWKYVGRLYVRQRITRTDE